ncbi:response regulator [Cohnella sp. CFH 77786]|uniref:response regulator transcription factor n=1 Tax=Cohnella sp. CFH 77786 TaxID=2662265 RepID=UPI001C60B52D|nr:response regulator [Cohnella sp. CFH 77786]MBW5449285.1 response regulator [Cohnella sp. CFH 77786]
MNILIADDEAIFRDYLRQALDWEALGFRICGEARNGVEALELSERMKPDLALVDINMPLMDGLALTEELKKRYPLMDIILVTGHNEFDYARTAIRLGVEDYILKPFSKDELVLTLLKCRQKYRDTLEARQTEQADRQLMAESILNRLISGEAAEPAERLAERLKQLGVKLGAKHTAACIEIDHMERRWNESAERQLWKFAVENILRETMEEEGELLVFHGPEGRIVCLRQENGDSRTSRAGLEGYEKVCRYIRKYLKLTVTIGVGTCREGVSGIRRSFEEARQALQSKFMLGEDRVIAYGDLESPGAGTAFPADTNETLAHMLRMGDWEGLNGKLEELFAVIRDRRLSLDLTYVACMGWVSVCLSHVSEAGHPIEDCFGEHFFPYAEIRRMETSEGVKAWMKSLFRQALEYVGRHKQTRSAVIAKNARQYIEQHYGDPELSVEGVAAHVFVNPSYLRAVFKKAYGMTAGEYIIHVRMTRAKALIGGPLRLSDVAERVGFADPGYFSRSFRKFFGVSPSEYENAAKGSKP